MFSSIIFANPGFLWCLLVVPLMIAWYVLRYRHQKPALQFSSISLFRNPHKTFRQRMYPILFILRMAAVTAIKWKTAISTRCTMPPLLTKEQQTASFLP